MSSVTRFQWSQGGRGRAVLDPAGLTRPAVPVGAGMAALDLGGCGGAAEFTVGQRECVQRAP